MENREKEIIVEGQIDSIDNNVLEPSDNKLIEEVDAIKEDKPAPVLYWERVSLNRFLSHVNAFANAFAYAFDNAFPEMNYPHIQLYS